VYQTARKSVAGNTEWDVAWGLRKLGTPMINSSPRGASKPHAPRARRKRIRTRGSLTGSSTLWRALVRGEGGARYRVGAFAVAQRSATSPDTEYRAELERENQPLIYRRANDRPGPSLYLRRTKEEHFAGRSQ
jgi:hypothetical protein